MQHTQSKRETVREICVRMCDVPGVGVCVWVVWGVDSRVPMCTCASLHAGCSVLLYAFICCCGVICMVLSA